MCVCELLLEESNSNLSTFRVTHENGSLKWLHDVCQTPIVTPNCATLQPRTAIPLILVLAVVGKASCAIICRSETDWYVLVKFALAAL